MLNHAQHSRLPASCSHGVAAQPGTLLARSLFSLSILYCISSPAVQADSKPAGIPGLAVKDVGPYYAF